MRVNWHWTSEDCYFKKFPPGCQGGAYINALKKKEKVNLSYDGADEEQIRLFNFFAKCLFSICP